MVPDVSEPQVRPLKQVLVDREVRDLQRVAVEPVRALLEDREQQAPLDAPASARPSASWAPPSRGREPMAAALSLLPLVVLVVSLWVPLVAPVRLASQ